MKFVLFIVLLVIGSLALNFAFFYKIPSLSILAGFAYALGIHINT